MRLALNLRGDLAKLNDAEIATRLDAALREIEMIEARRRASPLGGLAFDGLLGRRGWRGPLRARPIYRLLRVLPHLLDLFLNLNVDGRSDERALSLAHCEAKDLMDEIRRRLEARRRTEAVGRP